MGFEGALDSLTIVSGLREPLAASALSRFRITDFDLTSLQHALNPEKIGRAFVGLRRIEVRKQCPVFSAKG